MTEQVVKFMSRGLPRGADPGQFIRAFPGTEQRWGSCRFTLDVDETEYDWLVVYHDIPKDGNWLVEQKLSCPRRNTILITPEPAATLGISVGLLALGCWRRSRAMRGTRHGGDI